MGGAAINVPGGEAFFRHERPSHRVAATSGANPATHPPLRMTETFFSLQGEGVDIGLPTVFLRLTGCSLRCAWCDTAYSFYGGSDATIDEVVAKAESWPARRACVTGGEPLDQEEACVELMRRLLERGWDVVLETSGGVAIDKAVRLAPRAKLRISLDVKCPSSNMQERNVWSNLDLLEPHDQVKLVIADAGDYEYAKEVLRARPFRAQAILNPMWTPPSDAPGLRILEKRGQVESGHATVDLRWVAERVLADGLDVRVGTQLHKLIWGMEKGR